MRCHSDDPLVEELGEDAGRVSDHDPHMGKVTPTRNANCAAESRHRRWRIVAQLIAAELDLCFLSR
jgi:hypothetical protein